MAALRLGRNEMALAAAHRLLAADPAYPRALLILAEARSKASGEPILLEVFEAVSSSRATVATYAQAREVLREAGLTTSLGQLAEVMLRARPRSSQEVLSILGPLDSTHIALIREFAPQVSPHDLTTAGPCFRLARMLEWSGFPDEGLAMAAAAVRLGDRNPEAAKLYARLSGRADRQVGDLSSCDRLVSPWQQSGTVTPPATLRETLMI